jgi:ABC-type transporter Mla subunit MlaD
MTQNRRKLLGIFAILGSLVVHAIIFTAIYIHWVAGLPNWALIIYFAIAGMLWFFPAGFLITWMSRPDDT